MEGKNTKKGGTEGEGKNERCGERREGRGIWRMEAGLTGEQKRAVWDSILPSLRRKQTKRPGAAKARKKPERNL